jgi:DNA-binding transcriptional MerR regulator
VRYRVDDLAARCDVSVDTIRYYQTKGLLRRPEREGRVAWYDDSHVEQLARIRELKDQGFTLAMVGRVLAGELDAAEQALALAIAGPLPGQDGMADATLTIADLAQRTGVSPTLLEALARQELLVPRGEGDAARYTPGDADVVHAGLALLEAGVPLSELLELARRHAEAMQATAEHAVDLFARFVRDPIRAEAGDAEVAERTVAALHQMLPATGTLIAHHFRRQLLDAARARLEADGTALPAATDEDRPVRAGHGRGSDPPATSGTDEHRHLAAEAHDAGGGRR